MKWIIFLITVDGTAVTKVWGFSFSCTSSIHAGPWRDLLRYFYSHQLLYHFTTSRLWVTQMKAVIWRKKPGGNLNSKMDNRKERKLAWTSINNFCWLWTKLRDIDFSRNWLIGRHKLWWKVQWRTSSEYSEHTPRGPSDYIPAWFAFPFCTHLSKCLFVVLSVSSVHYLQI